jgi:hypothetical protein
MKLAGETFWKDSTIKAGRNYKLTNTVGGIQKEQGEMALPIIKKPWDIARTLWEDDRNQSAHNSLSLTIKAAQIPLNRSVRYYCQ